MDETKMMIPDIKAKYSVGLIKNQEYLDEEDKYCKFVFFSKEMGK